MMLPTLALVGLLATTAPAPEPDLRIGLVPVIGADAVVTVPEPLGSESVVDGRHVRLLTLASQGPWRDGAAAMARLIFEEQVVVLIGAADAASAHAAAQIATRARIPFITTCPETSLGAANDPWLFQAVPSDFEQARAILRHAVETTGLAVADVVVPPGRAGRERLQALRRALAKQGVALGTVARYDPGEPGGTLPVDRDRLLLLWLDPEPALSYLRRAAGLDGGRVLASSRLDDPRYLASAPAGADGLRLPALRGSDVDSLRSALERDIIAAVVEAAKTAGMADPLALREALRHAGRRCGASGCFRFDRHGRREGEIAVGVVRGGRISPITEPHEGGLHVADSEE